MYFLVNARKFCGIKMLKTVVNFSADLDFCQTIILFEMNTTCLAYEEKLNEIANNLPLYFVGNFMYTDK